MREQLDGGARDHAPATELRMPNVLTPRFSHATQVDHAFFTQLLLACRRKTMRMVYESP